MTIVGRKQDALIADALSEAPGQVGMQFFLQAVAQGFDLLDGMLTGFFIAALHFDDGEDAALR